MKLDIFHNISCFAVSIFQAKFKLTLEVPSELVALSNMPVANATFAGPIKTVRYHESPPMSTYLVAIVVGLFEYVEGMTTKGIISVSDIIHSKSCMRPFSFPFYFICLFNFIQAQEFVCTLKLVRVTKGSLH